MPKLYDTDYYAWTKRTAAALRDGRIGDIDLAGVAEEIEDLGKSERRAFDSALSQLLLHKRKGARIPRRHHREELRRRKAARVAPFCASSSKARNRQPELEGHFEAD